MKSITVRFGLVIGFFALTACPSTQPVEPEVTDETEPSAMELVDSHFEREGISFSDSSVAAFSSADPDQVVTGQTADGTGAKWAVLRGQDGGDPSAWIGGADVSDPVVPLMDRDEAARRVKECSDRHPGGSLESSAFQDCMELVVSDLVRDCDANKGSAAGCATHCFYEDADFCPAN